jgi:hypothetical protein
MTTGRPPGAPLRPLPESGGAPEAPSPGVDAADEAGDPACWAGLLCPDCGAVLSEGHQPGCPSWGPE